MLQLDRLVDVIESGLNNGQLFQFLDIHVHITQNQIGHLYPNRVAVPGGSGAGPFRWT